MHLPFLPTLVTAVVVAGFSFLCQGTGIAPTPAAELIIAPTSFADGSFASVETTAARPPAALAFAQVQPLVFEAAEPKLATRAAPRFAVLPPRRPCPRCGETASIPRRASPFAAAHPTEIERVETAPIEVGEADEPAFPGIGLPRVALPFAPVARVVGEATGMMRSGASALGSSAMMLVDRMR